ncbi:MAG: hypothetical protein CMD16_02070 [Flavobacteriales bacterium]|nr:hypothetical protein [Flavobacteriales bacterium]|tara:strand:+ start:91065 stop:91925 length:861 start_codon:yes stop_codon:yes gene_type:complete
MKKYITLLSIIITITACEKVEKPYLTDLDAYVNPDKKVLIEKFTGHRCSYCPDAARELESIHDIYGDQIIGMAIHIDDFFAGPSPIGNAFDYDFRTEWGDELDENYNIVGLPKGMVNRIGIPDESHILGKDEWASVVATELQKEIDFLITIDADTNKINISILLENNIINNYKLFVCLTESNIINWQQDGSENIQDYEHNHVLRTVIYNGELSNTDNLLRDELISTSFNINLSDLEQYNINYSENEAVNGNGNAGGWNASNMSVIAYIYNTNTKEVLQVEEAHLNN